MWVWSSCRIAHVDGKLQPAAAAANTCFPVQAMSGKNDLTLFFTAGPVVCLAGKGAPCHALVFGGTVGCALLCSYRKLAKFKPSKLGKQANARAPSAFTMADEKSTSSANAGPVEWTWDEKFTSSAVWCDLSFRRGV